MKRMALILIGILIISLGVAFFIFVLPFSTNEMIDESVFDVKTIPTSIEENCIGFVIGSPNEVSLISEIGGAWARPHPGPFAWGFVETEKGRFDFSITDEYVMKAQENNIALLGTIWPYADWDQAVCHSSSECEVSTQDIFYPEEKDGTKTGIPKSRCAPCSYEDYTKFIAKLVERYNGDMVEDMPGLIIPIKYWEVLNEPEMESDEITFFKGTQEEYISIFIETRNKIKDACSNCSVLHAGVAGVQDFMLEYWGEIYNSSIDFDIANIHYIGGTDLSTLNVKDFKYLLTEKNISKPIWVTEAEYKDSSEIVSSVEGALSAGASKIFFTQFKIGQFGFPENGKYSEEYNNIVEMC